MAHDVKLTTAWVCEDCLMAENGYETPNAECEPFGLATADEVWTAGLTWDEHENDCPNRAAESWVDDCECERREFSWTACDACGSHLGGSRHAYTVWGE